ncbi:serine carboxypeptidase-like 18 isoform X1 [Vigna radiata var. radiata]|uniref:Serine carboxypeptidase-like 18 isoform X1 n=1 Tax=Vigna radiata var. radiata TaxID=3916 RepID=A0A1S3VVD7_VIGRR|nr:serine carboxypeptidase-like 18 isoform X1 [Vigna radiata var. radiata]
MSLRYGSVSFVALVLLPLMASAASVVKNLPGYEGNLPFKLETGYIGVGEEGVNIFHLFVESQRNPFIDPVLLWFVGGPGCSALSAFFFENGPLIMNGDNSGNLPTLELNPYGWSQTLNMLYIDMPVGTGFSYSETQQGYYSNDTLWVDHTYEFLQKWFIDHPKFNSNPFYIGGGSYSGLITGPLVQKVYEGYKARHKPLINIKGYVLASPAVDQFQEENMKIVYAYQRSLISEVLYKSMKENCNGDYVNIDPQNTKCVSDYEAYSELVRYINEQQIMEPLCVTTPGLKREMLQELQAPPTFWCRSYYHIFVDKWANDENVRKALHVRKGTKEEFLRCNRTMAYAQTVQNSVQYYRNLTKANLEALVYCSDLDMSVPHLGTQHWINSFNMTIRDKWRAWFVDGQVAGYTELYKMKEDHFFTYVIVKGAGHVAQTFKPKEVYNLINRWFSFSLI